MILLHTELATLYDIEVEFEECVKKKGGVSVRDLFALDCRHASLMHFTL